MKTIIKILLGISILILLIGAVSANENATDTISDTANNQAPELIVEDYTTEYKSFDPLKVSLQGPNGNLIKYQEISEEFYGDLRYDADCIDNTGYTGIATHAPRLEAGEYSAYISTIYQGKTIYKYIDVNITKAPATITAYKITAQDTNYVILKAKVTDKNGGAIDEGEVTFTINGKSYTVYPNIEGIAAKKVKLTEAKKYYYSVQYTCRNYKTATSYSKVILNKPVRTIIINAGKHKKVFGDLITCHVKEIDGRTILKKPLVHLTSNGIDLPKNTKLLAAKMYFKNKYNGKIIMKTSYKVKWNAIYFKLPAAKYKVTGVKVWYQHN